MQTVEYAPGRFADVFGDPRQQGGQLLRVAGEVAARIAATLRYE